MEQTTISSELYHWYLISPRRYAIPIIAIQILVRDQLTENVPRVKRWKWGAFPRLYMRKYFKVGRSLSNNLGPHSLGVLALINKAQRSVKVTGKAPIHPAKICDPLYSFGGHFTFAIRDMAGSKEDAMAFPSGGLVRFTL